MLAADEALFRVINGLAGGLPPLDWAMQRLANDYLVPVSLALALLGLWFSPLAVRQARQQGVIAAALAVVVANAVVKLTNLIYFRPRPFVGMEVNLLFYRPLDSSFPSNTAAVAFAIAFAIFLVDRRAGLLLAIPAFLVSVARVFVGVHFPTDILGGLATGVLSAYFCYRLLIWQQPLTRYILRVARRFYLA